MLIQFLHLILLCYGVTDFAGYFSVMPHFFMCLWLFVSVLILFRWLPNYGERYIKAGRVPSFFKTYNCFCFIIAVWISLLFIFGNPVGFLSLDFCSLVLGTVLYLIFLKRFMSYLYLMLRPVLADEQTEKDFLRARMAAPMIFFPPVLIWVLLEDLGFGKGMELLMEVQSLFVAPIFILLMFFVAPKLLSFAWRGEKAGSELTSIISKLCKSARTEIAGVKIWNTFKEPVPNAAVSGVLRNFRYVFVTDYLLKTLSIEEVKAVVAHELGHFRLGHIATYMIFSIDAILCAILLKCSAVIYIPYFYVHRNLMYCMEGAFVAVFAILFTVMTRFCEYQADNFSAGITDKSYFISALRYIESISGNSFKWIPKWLLTHPKPDERIDNIKNNENFKISSLIFSAKMLRYGLLIAAIVLVLFIKTPISIVLQWSNLYNAAQAGNCSLVTDLCNSLPEWLQEHPFVTEQKEKVTVK